MTNQKNQFHLDIRIDELPPMKIDVLDTLTAGLDPRSDLVLTGAKIKNHQLIFQQKGENLALHYLGNSNQTFLNSLPLEENRFYLLAEGDTLQMPGVQILIHHEMVDVADSPKTTPVIFHSLENLRPRPGEERIIFAEKTDLQRDNKRFKTPLFDTGAFLSLWIIKFYSLLTDFFFTYLFLVVLLPLIFVETFALKILNYFSSNIFPTGHHAFFKFFMAWYFLSFIQTMVLGTTLGQFLLGLQNKNESTFGKLILFRLKTILFSLFLLPAQNSVSKKLFFKAIRKVGIVIVFLFILYSPLFLPPPFNQSVTILKDQAPYERELHTKTIVSTSKSLMMNLKAELSPRYMLLPFIHKEAKMRAFQFIDLKTTQEIVIYESLKLRYEDIDQLLEYGNPLYSLLHKEDFRDLDIKSKKELLAQILSLSPLKLMQSTSQLGPFFGSAILLKQKILDEATSNDAIVKFYSPSTPVFFVGGTQQDFFYLLAPHGPIRFVVDSIKRAPLVAIFEAEIFQKLIIDSKAGEIKNNQQVEILEAQDAFLQGDEQTLLTYYVGVAKNLTNQKIIDNDIDLTAKARAAVFSNIETVQSFIKDKNIYRSFEDIKYQLTPMEKPGEKR